MSKRVGYLADEPWRRIEPHISKKPIGRKGGRPRADDRLAFEGDSLGAENWRWMEGSSGLVSESVNLFALPDSGYGTDVLKDMRHAVLSELDHEGILEWDEVIVDASIFPAKKGAWESGKPSGKGNKVRGIGRWRGRSSRKPYRQYLIPYSETLTDFMKLFLREETGLPTSVTTLPER